MISKTTKSGSSSPVAEWTCLILLIVSAILAATLGLFSGFRWVAYPLGLLAYMVFWGLVTDIAKHHNLNHLAIEYSLAISIILCMAFSVKWAGVSSIPVMILALLYAFVSKSDRRYYVCIMLGALGILFAIAEWRTLTANRPWLMVIAFFAPTFLAMQRGELRLIIIVRLIIGLLVNLLGLRLLYADPGYFGLQLALAFSGAEVMFLCIPMLNGSWKEGPRTLSLTPWYSLLLCVPAIELATFPIAFFFYHRMIVQYGLLLFLAFLLCFVGAYPMTVVVRQVLVLVKSEYQSAVSWSKYFVSRASE